MDQWTQSIKNDARQTLERTDMHRITLRWKALENFSRCTHLEVNARVENPLVSFTLPDHSSMENVASVSLSVKVVTQVSQPRHSKKY